MNEVNNGIPLINGILCSWADIKVAIAGVLLTGITAIDYEDKQVVENVYGAGGEPPQALWLSSLSTHLGS